MTRVLSFFYVQVFRWTGLNIAAEFSEVLGFPVEVFEEFLQILVEFFNQIHFPSEFLSEKLLKSVTERPIK